MKKRIALGITLLAMLAAMAGCQGAAFQSGNSTGQGLRTEYNVAGSPDYLVITHRDGRVEIVALPPEKEASRAK